MIADFFLEAEKEAEANGVPMEWALIGKALSKLSLEGASEGEKRSEVLDKVSEAKKRLAKRKEDLHRRLRAQEDDTGLGEEASRETAKVELVALDDIENDERFENFRVKVDDEKLAELQESIASSGLHVPIRVVASGKETYHVRAGFRRMSCARSLGWKKIPAIVMPANTPEPEEYWANILENSARERLSTYELARAAQIMRDRFKVKPADFARRAGYSESYVSNLLRCMDSLPDKVIEHWRDHTGPGSNGYWLTMEELNKLAAMQPWEMLPAYYRMLGVRPQDDLAELRRKLTERKFDRRPRILGLEGMMKLYEQVEVSRNLEFRTRQLVLMAIEVCMGSRKSIPGVYDPESKTKIVRSRARKATELRMPEPPDPGDEDREMPPPESEEQEDDKSPWAREPIEGPPPALPPRQTRY